MAWLVRLTIRMHEARTPESRPLEGLVRGNLSRNWQAWAVAEHRPHRPRRGLTQRGGVHLGEGREEGILQDDGEVELLPFLGLWGESAYSVCRAPLRRADGTDPGGGGGDDEKPQHSGTPPQTRKCRMVKDILLAGAGGRGGGRQSRGVAMGKTRRPQGGCRIYIHA